MTTRSITTGIVLITAALMLPIAGWRLYVKSNRDDHAETVVYKLMTAISAGKIEKVSDALNSGVRVDQRDETGCTPLMVAIYFNQAPAVKLLVSHGADVNFRYLQSSGSRSPNYNHAMILPLPPNGSTPFLMCARNGNLEIGKMLIERGADAKAVDVNKSNVMSLGMQTHACDLMLLAVQKGASVNVTGQNGESVLMCAIESNNRPLALAALKAGCDVNVFDINRETALILAARLDSMPDVTLKLAKLSHDINGADGSGKTALAYAVQFGRVDLVKELVNRNARCSDADHNGNRPLIEATIKGELPIVKMLVQAGANVNSKDKNGMSALQWATARNFADIAAVLKAAGAR